METCSINIELEKYNKKTWLKSALLGLLIGIGVVVPGISGSTIAIIFGLYEQMLYAIGNVIKDFKRCVTFLLPILLGMALGMLLGFLFVKSLINVLPFAMICLFAGLMCGAFPAVLNEVKCEKFTLKRFILMLFGAIVPVVFGIVSVVISNGEFSLGIEEYFKSPPWYFLLACVPIGYLMGVTQVVPGLSATALLMMLGVFKALVDSISFSFWLEHFSVFLIYIAIVLGFVLGLITFSKLLTNIFAKCKGLAFTFIVGLSLGSIISMFFNPDSYEIYLSWKLSGVYVLDLVLAIVLFVVGFIVANYLAKREMKK